MSAFRTQPNGRGLSCRSQQVQTQHWVCGIVQRSCVPPRSTLPPTPVPRASGARQPVRLEGRRGKAAADGLVAANPSARAGSHQWLESRSPATPCARKTAGRAHDAVLSSAAIVFPQSSPRYDSHAPWRMFFKSTTVAAAAVAMARKSGGAAGPNPPGVCTRVCVTWLCCVQGLV